MDAAAILTVFRQELVNAALVRPPSVAGALPPMHVEPIDGAPAPGEREGVEDNAALVTSIFYSGDVTPEVFGTDRTAVIDVRYRSRDNAALRIAMGLDAAIRRRLTERLGLGGEYGLGYVMGAGAPAPLAAGAFVRQASVFGAFSRLSSSKATGFDHIAKYAIEVDA
jgi:hypothetical protein